MNKKPWEFLKTTLQHWIKTTLQHGIESVYLLEDITSEEKNGRQFVWMRKMLSKLPNKDAQHGNKLSIQAEGHIIN